jgi:hypothetical protein
MDNGIATTSSRWTRSRNVLRSFIFLPVFYHIPTQYWQIKNRRKIISWFDVAALAFLFIIFLVLPD